MILKHKWSIWVIGLFLSLFITNCKVEYTFTGASIPIEAKTFTIENIDNLAPTINPSLAGDLQLAFTEKMLGQTRLAQAPYDGDLLYDITVTGYNVKPLSISGGSDPVAAENRLTVSVKVKFKNRYETENEFEKSFSKFSDFPSTDNFADVESDLVDDIIEQLVDEIFNASVANW